MLLSSVSTGRRIFVWLLVLLPVLMQLPALLGYWEPDPSLFVGGLGDHFSFAGSYPWIDPNTGFQAQALGKLSADQWLSGQIPWWNAYNGVGLPLAAEAQPGSFFLPFVLLYHLRAGGLWIEISLQIVAGLCTFYLLRRVSFTLLASFVGAVLFEFNGTFAWHGAPIVTPIAFLPMLLLGVEQLRWCICSGRSGGWLLIPLALAWSIYAGFPETAYIDGLLCGLWVLARLGELTTRQKIEFTKKLCLAVSVGILLCLPFIVPFAEYVQLSYIGGHDGSFAHAALPSASALLSLIPTLFGPIDRFNNKVPLLGAIWGNSGGYFTALQLALALIGAIYAPRRLAAVLLIWMLLCLAKTFDLRPLSDLMNLLPMVKSAALFRYSPPSWEFAGVVLVAAGVNHLQHSAHAPYKKLAVVFIFTLLSTAGGLWIARDLLRSLLLAPGYLRFFYSSIFWLIFSLLAGAIVTGFNKHWHRSTELIAALLVFDCLFAFSLPVYSGAKNVVEQERGIAFLQAHVGLQRIYSLGPLAPNYGAYFRIAQINHNYLPISKNWMDYVHQHLDPSADNIIFIGESPRTDHTVAVEDELITRLSAYKELGVKYVLANPDKNPFIESLNVDIHSQGNVPLPLADGMGVSLHWNLPASARGRQITGLSVKIGNYNKQANGFLAANVCFEPDVCASGTRDLHDSVDNAALNISLHHALSAPSSGPMRVAITFSHQQSTSPVALWIWPVVAGSSQQLALDNDSPGFAPQVSLQMARENRVSAGKLVYGGQDMNIYELANPKPYFEIQAGQCDLTSLSRREADVNCQGPAKLTRREAFYPGWMASVNGVDSPVGMTGEIFQSVSLVSGKQKVVFRFRPSHFELIIIGFCLGIFGWLYAALQEWRAFRCRAVVAAD